MCYGQPHLVHIIKLTVPWDAVEDDYEFKKLRYAELIADAQQHGCKWRSDLLSLGHGLLAISQRPLQSWWKGKSVARDEEKGVPPNEKMSHRVWAWSTRNHCWTLCRRCGPISKTPTKQKMPFLTWPPSWVLAACLRRTIYNADNNNYSYRTDLFTEQDNL